MRGVLASLRFAFLSAGQNFRRNLAISMAGVFTMGLILLMVGTAALGTHVVDGLLKTEQSKASKLRIYLQDGVSLASVANYRSQLLQDPTVLAATFESKDQAAKEYAAQDPSFQNELNVIGSNPLPASINLTVSHLADLQRIAAAATRNPIVDTHTPTDYNQDVVKKLQTLISYIQWGGTGISVVLAFISLVIIMNTIRTAVFVRRTEIEIMKLVGATDWFVRWPFILEGTLGGVLAAAFSSVIVGVAYRVAVSEVHGKILLFNVSYDGSYLVLLLFILFGVGAGLGAFGSYLGVRRFLAV